MSRKKIRPDKSRTCYYCAMPNHLRKYCWKLIYDITKGIVNEDIEENTTTYLLSDGNLIVVYECGGA